MLILGIWVTSQIERSVRFNAGILTALYVDAVIAPAVQTMDLSGPLGAEDAGKLRVMLDGGALRDEISAFKLWNMSGQIVFSDRPDLVGRVFATSEGLGHGLAGRVFSRFSDGSHSDHNTDSDEPLLEVYSPVRLAETGAVIAVAEFYTFATTLEERLIEARTRSWLVVGAVSLGIFAALSIVYLRGSRTIRGQRKALDDQIVELSGLLEKNKALGLRVEQANREIASLNEKNLRRISAELHDGPVQLLSFAALRLDGAEARNGAEVRQAIDEALKEIRYICHGLALPELEDWPVATIVRRLAATHEARTGQKVALSLQPGLPDIALPGRICIYRFVQEALNNGAKHAKGAAQSVGVRVERDHLLVEIIDTGPGFDPREVTEGLGIAGLRERVTGLRGQFELQTGPDRGTRVLMRLPLGSEMEGT